METNVINKYEKMKDIIIAVLLTIWVMMPILKEIQLTEVVAVLGEYEFVKMVGFYGVLFLVFDIYINSQKIKDKKWYDKEILPITILGIFMIWTFVSCLFASNKYYAFVGTEYRKEGYITYLAYAGFFGCTFLLKSKNTRKYIINMFLAIALLNILIVKLYNMGIFTQIFADREITRTSFYNINHYGYYLLLATVTANFSFITEKNKYLKVIFCALYSIFTYYLILNNTFGVYLALAITLILFMIYAIYCRKKTIISMFSIAIFIFISISTPQTRKITTNNMNSFFKDINNIVVAQQIKGEAEIEIDENIKEDVIENAEKAGSNRIRLWKNGIKFFMERPILGYGPENLEEEYDKVGIVNRDRPHNLLIQVATTSGIIGLISYISAIGIILIRGLKTMKIDNAMHLIAFFNVIAYLISAMFGNSMYYTYLYFFMFLGFLMYENINYKIKSKEEIK